MMSMIGIMASKPVGKRIKAPRKINPEMRARMPQMIIRIASMVTPVGLSLIFDYLLNLLYFYKVRLKD